MITFIGALLSLSLCLRRLGELQSTLMTSCVKRGDEFTKVLAFGYHA